MRASHPIATHVQDVYKCAHRIPCAEIVHSQHMRSYRMRMRTPNSKVHGSNMGPIWGRQDPGGPHVGPMNFAIWDICAHDGIERHANNIWECPYDASSRVLATAPWNRIWDRCIYKFWGWGWNKRKKSIHLYIFSDFHCHAYCQVSNVFRWCIALSIQLETNDISQVYNDVWYKDLVAKGVMSRFVGGCQEESVVTGHTLGTSWLCYIRRTSRKQPHFFSGPLFSGQL